MMRARCNRCGWLGMQSASWPFVGRRRLDLACAVDIGNRHASDSGEERKGGGCGQGRSGEAVAQLPLRASHALARICPDPFRSAIIALCCWAYSALLGLDRFSSVPGRNGSLIWREVYSPGSVHARWIRRAFLSDARESSEIHPQAVENCLGSPRVILFKQIEWRQPC
jgi:hypothetical protein